MARPEVSGDELMARPEAASEMFAPGDRMPDFMLPDVLGGTVGLNLSATGSPLILIACASEFDRMLRPIAEARARFADCVLLCLTPKSPPENKVLAESLGLPFALLSDQSGQIISALTQDGRQNNRPRALAIYLLDANQRIVFATRGNNAARQLDRALNALGTVLPAPEPLPAPRPAPILYIPRVLEAKLCRELIHTWRNKGHQQTGTIGALTKQVERFDQNTKIRQDHYIRDQKLLQTLSGFISRRIPPEIEKAFCFKATQVEEFKIACYEGESKGFFRAHRDNLSERTRHRRFAMSLLLNDPDSYEGGGLRFPEYGPELYLPLAGDAVVFSCSLLHEVLPVTHGQRYVLLCFLFGDQEFRELAARKRGVG